MLKSLTLLSLAATLTLANAQSPAPAAQTQPPAPIVRSYQSSSYQQHRHHRQPGQLVESQPVPGVWLRSQSTSNLTTIADTPHSTEVRLDHGILNVAVHQPAQHTAILIDLPGGQTSILKDGLYTFNADTNTVRVLRGEADGYPNIGNSAANANAKPIKIKEGHQLSLMVATDARPGTIRPVESYPYELTADLLPLGNADDRGDNDRGYAAGYGAGYAEGYSPFAYYPYPYYAGAWGSPYGYGFYPGLGYGYPFGYGIGIGYYGGGFGGFSHGGFRR